MRNLTERWQKFNAVEQMANIGSEVYRAFLWRQKNEKEKSRLAGEKVLELFDFTLSDPRWRETTGRLKEIARAREIFYDLFFGENQYNDTRESLMKYFDEFAVSAKKDR